MEKNQVSKRLYVGGLGHTVSKGELAERFGKFGHVLDAEIITRKDEQGNPMKTFAYISVNISDGDLKKCMSVLNRTKWKGGMLQIELAKESFLHRLAVEREEAKLQKEKPLRSDGMCLLESLNKAGVTDFHMKAVPGTEVPDHKKWVVGKFGRVLPVLHLRKSHCFSSLIQTNIVKYDPSKYCHNLRKLDPDTTPVVPISDLTWHLEERADNINKKRQGEFPVTRKPTKKPRQQSSETLNGVVALSAGCQSHSKNTRSPQLDLISKPKPSDKSKLPLLKSTNSNISGRCLLKDQSSTHGGAGQKNSSVSDSDVDSEEEIQAMVKKEMEIWRTGNAEAEDAESNHLEIVGDNFELKYSSHWSLSNPDTMRKAVKRSSREKEAVECDNGYDSAGTDEIIAVSKTVDRSSSRPETLPSSNQVNEEHKEILTPKRCNLVNDSSLQTQTLKEKFVGRNRKINKSKSKPAASSTAVSSAAETGGCEGSSPESGEGESEISSDYESMMQNCYRLDLTLDDLKALATENTRTPTEESDSAQSRSPHTVEESPVGNVNKKKMFHPVAKKKCVCPEDVVAAILAGKENVAEESCSGQNNSCLKYQPFRGMGSLCKNVVTQDSAPLEKGSVERLGVEACSSDCGEEGPKVQIKNCLLNSLEISKKRQNLHCEKHKDLPAGEKDQPVSRPRLQGKKKDAVPLQGDQKSGHGDDAATPGQSEDESSDMDSPVVPQKCVKQPLKSPKPLKKKIKRNVSNKNSEKKKQLQDNQRRLAALEERHRERELQKKLIQGALSNLDNRPAGRNKHIVFDSDAESEAGVDVSLGRKQEEVSVTVSSCLTQDKFAPKASCRLFESSDDEQGDADDERFQIKPQFEGKAGEKLLKLQSQFGTDERFRMDARFLESDSEEGEETNNLKADEDEELAAEKRKNLQILGSLLNINLEQPKPTKMATNAKKFRDINALRYDPTRQDHAVFEKKPNATEKESKAKRKKEEESEKPPEVSKETYYNIAVDLKELFASSKSKSGKTGEMHWDKDNVEDSSPPEQSGLNSGSNGAEDSGVFRFSFFSDTENLSKKEELYVLETIKPAKVPWQEDPRFQDSSSEGDDESEVSESKKDREMQVLFVSLPHAEGTRFFFFSKDDERLREGPKLFCRSGDLSEEKEGWEDRRRLLLDECRKKHKDARRKVKAK
ncbi:NOL8 protein, partial [Upupa epops]|nr:NOL8 protein [Upupa epops]